MGERIDRRYCQNDGPSSCICVRAAAIHLSLTSLVGTTDNENLVVLADGDGAGLRRHILSISSFQSLDAESEPNLVLSSEFLAQRRRHERADHAGGGIEVSLAGLAAA